MDMEYIAGSKQKYEYLTYRSNQWHVLGIKDKKVY